MPFDALYYSTAILGGAAVIGGISTYNLEHALRTNFLETRLLNELAERDGMTGLYNRRIFDDYVERLWRQSRREGTGVAIIFVDIDFFKVYNDLYGHQAGDDCLKRVAKCIARGAKRPFDFAARYGGEEFVLVLYGPPDDYARSVPEQIRRDVLELAIPHAGSQAAKHVTVSVGLALAQARDGPQPSGRDSDGRRGALPGEARRPQPRRVQGLRQRRRRDRQLPRHPTRPRASVYHAPVFGIEAQGSAFGSAAPFCSSSIEMLSGERMNAILPSRGGRLIVTPGIAQPRAQRVDVVDLVGHVTEVAPARVLLGIPIVRELDRAVFLARRRDEHEREAPGLVIDAANLLQAELVAVEVERLLEVADAHHCMQIPHDLFSLRVVGAEELATIPKAMAAVTGAAVS